jgi:hypothetical protein
VESGSVDPDSNVVMWIREEWPFDARYVAKTRLYYDRQVGRIVKVEVALNGRDYRWSTNGKDDTLDVQNVATHEMGHFVGLGDVQTTGQTMFEYILLDERSKRSLTDDDIDGARAIYPMVSQDEQLSLKAYSIDYMERNVRPAEKTYPLLKTEGFIGLCSLSDPSLSGIIKANDGVATLSIMGPAGTIANDYVIQFPYAINPGRIRAISSLDGDGDGIPSDVAALVSMPDGMMLLSGTVPGDDDVQKHIVMTSRPVEGADEVMAFAPIAPREGETGAIVAIVEKRRNSDFYVSIVRAARGGEDEQAITLTELRSWGVPDCTSIIGLATRDGKNTNREIVLLLRNGRGGTEVAVYSVPPTPVPTDGELLEPTYRISAGTIASAGRAIAVSSILSNDPDELRTLSIILAK